MKYEEILKQEYAGNNCIFSAGFVSGHEVDTMYIRLEKDGEEPEIILLRPDEMACIAWLASGVLWSNEIDHLTLHEADLRVTCPECKGRCYKLLDSGVRTLCPTCNSLGRVNP